MAGLLAYEGDIPDSVRRSAQAELDYQRAIKNKLPLSQQGSGIPDSVRKAAQSATEGTSRYNKPKLPKVDVQKTGPMRGYLSAEAADYMKQGANAATPATEQAAKQSLGKGLLSAAGKVGKVLASPATLGVQAALTPGDMEDPNAQEEWVNRPEGLQDREDAAKYAKNIQELTKQAAKDVIPREQARQAVTVTPAQAEQAAKQKEAQRQQVENTTKKALQTSQLSRTKAAEEVVKADIARVGADPTPAEKKKLVAEEVKSMRSMDNSQLAKYLSYAVMGAGLIAGASSEENGRIWANAYQTGYQNQLAEQIRQQNLKIEAEQRAVENALKERDQTRKEKDTNSLVSDRSFDNDMSVKNLNRDLAADELDANYKGARLGQYAQGLDIDRDRLAASRERNAILNRKTEADIVKTKAQTAKLDKLDVPDISHKDATAAISSYFKDNSQDVSEGAASTIADQFVRYRKKYPNVDTRALIEAAAAKAGVAVDESWGNDDLELEFGE